MAKIIIDYKKPLESKNTETMLAGASIIDITPPPGMPQAGFAMFSTIGYGVRTKLNARTLYIKPRKGKPVALVQCDLLSGSSILHHKAAELAAGKTDVDCAAIVIAGTHTHSGPGNYFGNKVYNDGASNKAGLEEKYFEFCSTQIAKGIIDAYENRKPAKIATGTTEIWNVTINRSLQPYLLNENIKNLDKKPDELEAVNPKLHMIRIDCLDKEGAFKPMGMFTNFSMHPNTNPAELGGLYSGDITGFVVRETESVLKNKYKPGWHPVHAAANYTHGDCNANHAQDRVENFKDHKKLAKIISGKTLELFFSLDKKLKKDVEIKFRAKEVNFLNQPEIDGIRINRRGFAGMSVPAGAMGRGRTTPFYKIPMFRPGKPRDISAKGNQEHKKVIMGPLQRLIIPKKSFPHELLVQVIQIDDTILIPLPWEVTQEIGARIGDKAKEMGEAEGLEGVNRYIVTDTSNAYFGYLTTPEEYSLQYYEGGSNFYGQHTGPYVAAHVGHVTQDLASKGSGGDLPQKWEVTLPSKKYYPEDRVPLGKRKINRKPAFHRKPDTEESFWSFEWYDVPPSRIEFHKPLIKIEVSRDNKKWAALEIENIPVDDNGPDIAIIYKRKIGDDNMGLYEARWHNPVDVDKYYRFAIMPRGNHDVFYSTVFN